MIFFSSRGAKKKANFIDVMTSGVAPDGGLYVPSFFPDLSLVLSDDDFLDYSNLASKVLHQFCGDIFDLRTLEHFCRSAYSGFAVGGYKSPVNLVKLSDDLYIYELFHGPTLAFKDLAMQMLGQFLPFYFSGGIDLGASSSRGLILGATSGDTGAAAVEAFKNKDNLDCVILFPKDRISTLQQRQMTTTGAGNVKILAIEGTFDDCQNICKQVFNDNEFRSRLPSFKFLSINSINFIRILLQSIYYIYLHHNFRNFGNFEADKRVIPIVPSGNFGNALSAYYAGLMGFRFDKIGISTNRNDVLHRISESGKINLSPVEASLSPSMDIQQASNFERILFHLHDGDSGKIMSYYRQLADHKSVDLNHEVWQKYRDIFSTFRCDDEEIGETIRHFKNKYNYILDPHTATAAKAFLDLDSGGLLAGGLTGDLADSSLVKVVLATAHPSKFPVAMKEAFGEQAASNIKHQSLQSKLFAKEDYQICSVDYDDVIGFIEDFVKR